MWRNAKRQSDRYYDEDVFINPDNTELDHDIRSTGLDNTHMSNPNGRSRDNLYEYRDSPSSKTLASKMTDMTSVRSPSSLGKSASQASLKSAISMKETNGIGPTQASNNYTSSRVARPVANGVAVLPTGPLKPTEEKRLLPTKPADPQPLASLPAPVQKSAISPNTTSSLSSRSATPPVPVTRQTTTTATLTSLPHVQRPAANTSSASSASATSGKSARTEVIEGVPQTSV